KRGQRGAQTVKHRDQPIGKCEARGPHHFIAPRARRYSFVAVHDAATPAKSPKKFHIFNERHIWKSPSANKRFSPAEDSVVAASHSKQEARVMRKAVRQSVN